MIAILVLTYNNLEATKECIEKLYSNTQSDFHLFILDNNSTDETVDYLDKLHYDNFSFILSPDNIGIINGRNRLWQIAYNTERFNYFCFLDNDQFVQEGWDKKYLELMKEYDVVGVEAWQMKQNFQPTRRIKNDSEYFCYVGCGGMMIKEELVEDVGVFDTQFNPKYYEDPDYCFRAIKNGYKVGWCADRVIEHQKHNLKLSPEERVFFMRNLKVIQKKWRTFPLPKVKMKGTPNG